MTVTEKKLDVKALVAEEGLDAVKRAREEAVEIGPEIIAAMKAVVKVRTLASGNAALAAIPMTSDENVAKLLADTGLGDLGVSPSAERLEAVMRALAVKLTGADSLKLAIARTEIIAKLKEAGIPSPAGLVDAAIGVARVEGDDRQGRALLLEDPEAWAHAVDGAGLLDELARTHRRGGVFGAEGAAVGVALWIMHTYALEAAQVTPRLGITSPVKRCGKTRLLTLLQALVRRPLPTSNTSTAAIFRSIEMFKPSLLADEADTFLMTNEEMRGILNAGHTRAGATICRVVGEDHEPRIFSVWGAVAIALIGKLPATLEDRSIDVPMRRRAPGETVERLRLDRLEAFEPLRRRAFRWATDHVDELRAADPDVPPGLDDRAADNWRPLLAIADRAGGAWPEDARKAALTLSGGRTEAEGSRGILLLGDLRDIFGATEKLSTEDMLTGLHALKERPWPAYGRNGKPLTPRQLADLLKPFGVVPKTIRLPGNETPKGYERRGLEDAFSRYLPVPSATPPQANNDAGREAK